MKQTEFLTIRIRESNLYLKHLMEDIKRAQKVISIAISLAYEYGYIRASLNALTNIDKAKGNAMADACRDTLDTVKQIIEIL